MSGCCKQPEEPCVGIPQYHIADHNREEMMIEGKGMRPRTASEICVLLLKAACKRASNPVGGSASTLMGSVIGEKVWSDVDF